jgi:hypothetical protein
MDEPLLYLFLAGEQSVFSKGYEVFIMEEMLQKVSQKIPTWCSIQ